MGVHVDYLGVLWFITCVGCGEHVHDPEPLGTRSDKVEVAQRGVYYDVAFAPAPSLAELAAASPELAPAALGSRFFRELSAQAAPYWSSASITSPALTKVGGDVLMAPPPATSRIRYSCGATLISPSFALTAGHCVLPDQKLDELRLQMYRPTALLAETWSKSATLSGSWPLLSHPLLEASDGYLLDEYACTIKARCYRDNADNIACPSASTDAALLECEGRPGDKYGFLNVGTSSASGKEALMHWKHELLDVHVADPIPAELVEHYVLYPPSPEQNYHYFEAGNQLLALRSIDWPGVGAPHFLNNADVDVNGCHGSSGSGVLAREGESAEYRLVGPVATGSSTLSQRLCSQFPNPGGPTTGPGLRGLGVGFPEPQKLLEQHAADLESDCRAREQGERDVSASSLPFDPGSHRPSTLFSFLDCQLDDFAHDGSVAADSVFGPYPDRFVDDASAVEHALHGFELEAEADYRVALQAQSLRDCADCPSPELRVGALPLDVPPELTEGRTLLAATFRAPAAGALEVAVSNDGTGLALGGFSLIREGQVNSFDVLEDRLEAALYALDSVGAVLAGPAPMRFTGDGQAGFAAQLKPGERLVLLRQALTAAHRWSVRLGADAYDELQCGLLDLTGAPLLGAPCASFLALDDAAGTGPRLGFFVELPTSAERTSALVTYVALASDSARDADADAVPDSLDNCPDDWNAAQGECSEEPPMPEGGAGGAGGEGGSSGGTEQGGSLATVAGGGNAAGGKDAPSGGVSGSGATASASAGSSAGSGSDRGGNSAATVPSAGDDAGCSCRVPRPSRPRNGAPFWIAGLLLCWRLRRSGGR